MATAAPTNRLQANHRDAEGIQWILIGEFIGTTSLGNSFFVQSSGLK
jgi:hypothetical protein